MRGAQSDMLRFCRRGGSEIAFNEEQVTVRVIPALLWTISIYHLHPACHHVGDIGS